MPVLECSADELIQRYALALGADVSLQASCDEQAHKAMHITVLFNPCPIEPDAFVIVAIRVVVALLRVTHFVPHQNHGHAER